MRDQKRVLAHSHLKFEHLRVVELQDRRFDRNINIEVFKCLAKFYRGCSQFDQEYDFDNCCGVKSL